MKNIITLCLFALSFATFAQADADYLRFKNKADACFKNADYTCAKQNYENALAVKNNDSYCKQKLSEINQKAAKQKQIAVAEQRKTEQERKQLQAENEELRNQIQAQTKPYYGSLFGLKDRYGDNYNYTGMILSNLPNGKGAAQFNNGDKFEGYYINGLETGKGKYTWASGDIYEGDFVDGKRNGKGKLTLASGDIYEGDFVDGKRNGKGKYTWAIGDIYEGDFVDGKINGNGTYYAKTGTINNCPNCIKYIGYWKNEEKSGRGKCYDKNGTLLYDGEFADDKPVGQYPMTFSR
ncbi:MAG: hypothetical protein IPQ23_02605 [Cytophagaceae bacterium]|nr:hypothetical protein [Cytophagaceae bacterium]